MHVSSIQRIAAAVGLFVLAALDQVAKLGTVESLAFARLYEEAFEHFVGLAVDNYLDSFFEFARVDRTHWSRFSESVIFWSLIGQTAE